MNRDFYSFGNFFLGLAMVVSIFQSVLFLKDPTLFLAGSFVYWLIISALAYIIAAMFLLIYFHVRGYRLSFFSFLFVTLASVFQFALQYDYIVYRALQNCLSASPYITLIANIVYAVSLIFSKAKERLWLNKAGILLLSFCLAYAAIIIIGLVLHNNTANRGSSISLLTQISLWVMLAANLIMVLFILNFLSEKKELKASNVDKHMGLPMQASLSIAGMLLSVLILFLAFGFVRELKEKWAYENRGSSVAYTKKAMEMAKPFEARTYTNSKGYTLRYRLMTPLNYNPQIRYPMVLCLASQYGTENFWQIEGSSMAQLLSKEENRKKYPAFLLVPECPPGKSWGNLPGLPAEDSIVFEAIAALQKQFSVDEKRLYVTGHSFGGYGTWHFICARPDLFAAAMPMAAGGDPALAKKIIDLPVWCFHGRKDRNVLVKESRDMIEAIKKAGGHPRYTEFADAAHGIWDEAENTPGFLDWLFAQKRH